MGTGQWYSDPRGQQLLRGRKAAVCMANASRAAKRQGAFTLILTESQCTQGRAKDIVSHLYQDDETHDNVL